MENTDAYYIDEIRAGGARQEKAIELLYKQYFYLVKTGRKSYPKLEDDDLVVAYNSALISLRKQLVEDAFRGDSTISTYLHRIFLNKCIDILRRQNGYSTEPIERVPEEEDGENDALKKLIQTEQIALVFHHLNEMGEPCKQILLDSEYWGYSAEEIANRIGFKNAASVTAKKYTCLQRLRELLGGKN